MLQSGWSMTVGSIVIGVIKKIEESQIFIFNKIAIPFMWKSISDVVTGGKE